MRRIYTIPPGRPFLTALADALLTGELPVPGGMRPGPLQLADTTLLLPTRRATRALQEAFLRAAGGAAVLLPRIRPIIGAAEEDLGALASAEDLATDATGEVRPAIGDMGRQLALAKLIIAWSEAEGGTRTPAQAAKLARELARLMDAMEIEDVDPLRMQSLVPDTFARHWERTLQFLTIVTEAWPAHLDEHGLVSKMRHDKHLVLAQARRLRAAPPGAPVIVAGVMSSVPAVTELLSVVAGLPNGALVLPGLDQALDEESWNAIVPAHPEHPQFGLKKLLDALGVRREDVQPLPGPAPDAPQRARAALVSEAMRPARTTERWHRFLTVRRRQGARRWRRRWPALPSWTRPAPRTRPRRSRSSCAKRWRRPAGRRRSSRPTGSWRAGWPPGLRRGTCTSRTPPDSRWARPRSARSSISSSRPHRHGWSRWH